jgi:hypothetical protein
MRKTTWFLILATSLCLAQGSPPAPPREYPAEVAAKGLQRAYDTAKWTCYLAHFLRKQGLIDRREEDIDLVWPNLGACDLRLKTLGTLPDTAVFTFQMFCPCGGQWLEPTIYNPDILRAGYQYDSTELSATVALVKGGLPQDVWRGLPGQSPLHLYEKHEIVKEHFPEYQRMTAQEYEAKVRRDYSKTLQERRPDLHPWLEATAVKYGYLSHEK